MKMIPQDKANRFVIGALISAAVFLLPLPFIPAGWAMVTGFVVACVAGLVKESADRSADRSADLGTPDPWDFYWTVFGVLFPVSVALAAILTSAPR